MSKKSVKVRQRSRRSYTQEFEEETVPRLMTGPGNDSTFSVVVSSLELLISAVVECVGNDACVNIRASGAGSR